MIFICIGCSKTRAGRHDNSAHVASFVCALCQQKGVKKPPLPGEKTRTRFIQSRTTVEIRSFMRPKQKRT